MKYLKYFFGIFAFLMLLLIGNGFLNPSISYTSEISVDKSIQESWAVMNDPAKTPLWLKGITNIEHVSGEKGAIGAVTKYAFNQDGQESIIFETIKALRPEEHIAMDFKMEGVMHMDYQVDFHKKDVFKSKLPR